jgi:hypothetical protein
VLLHSHHFVCLNISNIKSRPVTVTKFVMKDTIEERMIKLQSAKKTAKGSTTMEAQATAGSIHDDKVNLKLDEFDELFGIDGSLYPRSEIYSTDDGPDVKRAKLT